MRPKPSSSATASSCRRNERNPAGPELSNLKVTTLNPAVVEWESAEAGDLLDRARAGEADAFCEICKIHESGLLRQAAALCGNQTLAEDLAQDTLVEAWKCLGRYNGRCRFFTWLCAIMLNRYRNVLRERRLRPSFSGRTDEDEAWAGAAELASNECRPDEAALRREQAALVRRCVEALPPKHQQVVHLRFYVDDSLEGIAAALGCSVGTVKSRLFHALDKLRGMKAAGRFGGETFAEQERTSR